MVIADLESMTFVTSGFADMPVSRWILHVSATMKGDAAPGDLVELNVLGGPVQRQPERPDLFVTLPGLQIPSLGDRLVLFLQPADGHGPLELVNTRNMYIIEDGRVVDDESARIAGIVGMSEAELITLLTRNPDTQP